MSWTRTLGPMVALILVALVAAGSSAQEATSGVPASADEASVTHHSVEIEGRRVPYTATAGTLPLVDRDNETLASVFFIAYTKEDVKDKTRRPLTFLVQRGTGSRFGLDASRPAGTSKGAPG